MLLNKLIEIFCLNLKSIKYITIEISDYTKTKKINKYLYLINIMSITIKIHLAIQ